jgi:hypothetical protein
MVKDNVLELSWLVGAVVGWVGLVGYVGLVGHVRLVDADAVT